MRHSGEECKVGETGFPESIARVQWLYRYSCTQPLTGSSTVPKPAEGEVAAPEPPPAPETFTVGVTDYTFNPINAIFGRVLKSKDGHIVTPAYWQQKETVSHDEIPYYEQG